MASNDTVELLAGGIAHDFDALLNAIVGHADTLTDCRSPGDPRAAQVDAIRRAAEQAAALTQQLLAYSRTQPRQPAVLNLNRGSETVLLLGDDAAVQGFISDVLRRRGYRMLVAQDAFGALRLAADAALPIDLLITAGSDGRAVVDHLRQRQPNARVLDVPLGKPLTPDGLARRVRGALGREG